MIGFLFVIAMSRLSAKKETTVELEASADSTPVKKSPRKKRSTPLAKKTGTVMTPAGRRSARIAASSTKKPRRKED